MLAERNLKTLLGLINDSSDDEIARMRGYLNGIQYRLNRVLE